VPDYTRSCAGDSLRIGRRRGGIPLYSFDCNEPVHVRRDRQQAKFWLAPVALAWNHRISARESNDVRRAIVEHEQAIIGACTAVSVASRITSVEVTDEAIIARLVDGRVISVPSLSSLTLRLPSIRGHREKGGDYQPPRVSSGVRYALTSMGLLPGTRLGPYEVVAPLGAGGMGEVYRARDTRLGRAVALKILPDTFATDAERVARFEREARALAALNHPSIAQIHGLEDVQDASPTVRRAIVMELVEGEDLSARIARGPIPLDEALAIARQITDALDRAHEVGIVHRDLKPANIMLRDDGSVKVLDFGLARSGPLAGATPGTPLSLPTITSPAMLTVGGVILGTAAYMAPEQAKGKPVDRRADIWAFGCVLYEMITGRRPFDGEDITDIIAAVITKEPDWTGVPTPVRRLLQRCLEKDPRRRLRDIGDVWTLLDDTPGASTPAARSSRLAAGLAVVAVTAIAAASALAVVHFRERPAAAPEIARLHMTLPVGAAPDLNFRISPDGRRVAFLGRGSDGVLRMYLRELETLDVRPLAGTEQPGSGSLFWSPDSRWIAFANQGRLKKIDVIGGGPVQTLADVTGAGVIGGAWSRDGVMVFGSNRGGRPGSGGLFKLSADGGRITPVTVLDVERQETGHRHPSFLPDGRRFLYLRTSDDPEQSGIFVGHIDSAPEAQSPTRVLATTAGPALFFPPAGGDTAAAGRLLFFRANALMVQPFDLQTLQLTGEPRSVAEPVGTFIDRALFSATPATLVHTTAAGALDVRLQWHDASGGAIGDPAGVSGAYSDLGLSPDGTRAVVAASEFDRGTRRTLWMMDFVRKTRTRLTFGIGRDTSPIWSPDGTAIFYVTNLADGMTIYRKRVNGQGNDEMLLKESGAMRPTSISRDGRSLLFTVLRPTTGLDIWVLPLDGDRTPYPLVATPLAERDAQLSPDGRWVAYVEQDPAGRSDVFVRPFAPAGSPAAETKWQVSTDGGDLPHWLHDGRQLSYVIWDGDAVRPTVQSLLVSPVRLDASRVVVVDVGGSPDARNATDGFQFGPPRPLLTLPRGTTLFALADEGKRVLAATPVETNAAPRPLTVVLNWLDGLAH
jgi:eukaryotic-like serine/threonine-protein kinase